MQRFAGVLLEMQALDADLDLLGRRDIDDDDALADDRALILRDLIALRQIGIEIIFPVEDGAEIDLRLEAEPAAHRLGDAFLIDDGQHAGHGGIDERDMGIGLAAEFRRGAGKELRLGDDLGMGLDADDDLPIAGRAFDEFRGFRVGGHALLF